MPEVAEVVRPLYGFDMVHDYQAGLTSPLCLGHPIRREQKGWPTLCPPHSSAIQLAEVELTRCNRDLVACLRGRLLLVPRLSL